MVGPRGEEGRARGPARDLVPEHLHRGGQRAGGARGALGDGGGDHIRPAVRQCHYRRGEGGGGRVLLPQ